MPEAAIPFVPVIAAGIGAAGNVAAASIDESQPRAFSGGAPGGMGAAVGKVGGAIEDLIQTYGSGKPEGDYETSPDMLSSISFDPHPPAIPREIEQRQFEPSPWGGLLSARLNPNGRGY